MCASASRCFLPHPPRKEPIGERVELRRQLGRGEHQGVGVARRRLSAALQQAQALEVEIGETGVELLAFLLEMLVAWAALTSS